MSMLRLWAKAARDFFLDRVMDRSGETTEHVALKDIGLDRSGYHDYEPSGWKALRRTLRLINYGSEDSIVDVGCGKGRILSQAARQPFKRVYGVELSPEMADQARARLEAERGRWRCNDVEVVAADVTTWEVPDDITIVYFYNPLSGDGLHAFLDRLTDSVRRAPRRVTFAYVHPLHEDEVAAHPDLELVSRHGKSRWAENDPRRITIFEMLPPGF